MGDFLASLLLIFTVGFWGVIIACVLAAIVGCGSGGALVILIILGCYLAIKILKEVWK
ncbi:hypothetical protein SAMN02910292_02873 [Lachnospiraceae bacterium XBB2008]|nr:hypothetical protein SAMN02910292_02873 [Lachnospiraceae bacterium XBB2008]